MKFPNYIAICLLPSVVWGQATEALPPPAKRTVTLDLARTLLTVKSAGDLTEDEAVKKNPFSPFQPPAPVVDAPAAETSAPTKKGRDHLESIVSGFRPSGTVKVGDTTILLFGQKKFKVGDNVSIVFEGATYELNLAAIDRTSFTLRLNGEEITRPINNPVAPKP